MALNGIEQNRTHIVGWVDYLRVFACFLVVYSHCCDGFVAQFDNDRESFLTGVFMGSLARPCVPLFVMMTAALLLPLRSDAGISAFYKKRVGRLLIPFLFWSLALPLLFYAYFATIGSDTANPSIPLASYTPEGLVNRLYTFVLNFNFDTTPLWYLYMLVGLYLLMPILNAWMQSASKKDLLLVLRIWGVSLLLPYVKMLSPLIGYQGNYGNMEILGGCDWNVFTTFYYFSGFAGYLVLTYYLQHYPLNWSWKKLWSVCIPMFIIGYLITSFGYVFTQQYFPGNYAYLEILWLFCGINVFLMTISVFLVFQKWNPAPSTIMHDLAKLTFGIYLCHFIFVQIGYDVFDISGFPYWLRIMCMALSAFVVSMFVSKIFYSCKWTKRFVS